MLVVVVINNLHFISVSSIELYSRFPPALFQELCMAKICLLLMQ